MTQKLFTKSAFKVALECPASLYYYRNPDLYANHNVEDDFLEALADGGFQVGALAKVYYGITEECDLENLVGYDEPLARTRELLQREKVVIAEAAFRFGDMFVKADIVRKEGDHIDLVEVKAKSWGGPRDVFLKKGKEGDPKTLKKDIAPYVYDVAFQKYVISNALREMFPGRKFTMHAALMMADKRSVASVDGMSQKFMIKKDGGKTKVKVVGSREDVLAADRILVEPPEVDGLCDEIIAGTTGEQSDYFGGHSFVEFVAAASAAYVRNERLDFDVPLGTRCFKCPFYATEPGKKDGYDECWCRKGGVRAEDLATLPLVEEMNGAHIDKKRRAWLQAGKYFLRDLSVEDIGSTDRKRTGLTYLERDLVQTALSTGRLEMLSPEIRAHVRNGVYLDVGGLREEMDKWVWPLHMIDFETSASALPFYAGHHPYEDIAFQFSHHVIERDGTGYKIRHAGQYINTEKGVFPNFNFVRHLKAELEKDGGSVFRYAVHENKILNSIRKQLRESQEDDRDELIAFIETLTHPSDNDPEDGRPKGVRGVRDMVDLCEIVKRFFWHPVMKGSNSIKVVLPAVLNSSGLLKAKYARPVYGREIPSLNISADTGKAWISIGADGMVENPYKKLPPVVEFFPADVGAAVEKAEDGDESVDVGEDAQVNNGGAALWAYGMMQFSDRSNAEALTKALLRYCELDTLAMVFIWEYFNEMCQQA